MSKPAIGSEKELAAHIINYLRQDGYDIYQEVPYNGNAADIVACRGPLICVVETKKNLGLDVIEQAHGWLKYANLVYCGVWKPKRSQITFGRQVAKQFGIGTIEVTQSDYEEKYVKENINPEYRRRILPGLREALRPEMMTGEYGESGTNKGGRFTPFRETTEALLVEVRRSPGIELKPAIEAITRHHYSSNSAARANLRKYIENGVIKGVRHELVGKKFLLWPVENSVVIN